MEVDDAVDASSAADGFVDEFSADVPCVEKDTSLLIESSHTVDGSRAYKRTKCRRKARRGRKKQRCDTPVAAAAQPSDASPHEAHVVDSETAAGVHSVTPATVDSVTPAAVHSVTPATVDSVATAIDSANPAARDSETPPAVDSEGLETAVTADSEETPAAADSEGVVIPTAAPPAARRQRLNRRQRRRRSWQQPAPILRPLQVPHAPFNSTSFIMDEHEDSAQYLAFDVVEDESEEAALRFSQQDFDTVYRAAHVQELSCLHRHELAGRLQLLEARLRQLEAELSRRDPQLWVRRLQNQLLQLQDENRLLHKTRQAMLHNAAVAHTP